ncbi:MAG: hypothetical protein RIR02_828 [Pseudomonadota bacterium]|jgi:hypothetical protein
MLITFKSKAAADVLMYQQHAQPMLNVLGKLIERGVITAEEMPDAITKLEAEIARQKVSHGAQQDDNEDQQDHQQAMQSVGFAVRAFPLLEMMRAAKRDHAFIMWGV